MAKYSLTYEIGPDGVRDVQVAGRPLAEASHSCLVELVTRLIAHGNHIRERVGSPGLERRAWAEKPPEERKPGAPLHDLGGVR